MTTALATTTQASIAGLEAALLDSDLSRMNEQQRVQFYARVCESVGLNPLTQPFEYLRLNGKMILYAKRACTDQLRKIHGVSLTIVSRETVGETYVVTARATMPDGRCDESIGAVPLKGLAGESLSNALMKGETKAKRRVTLSICGLSSLDESEADSVPAQRLPTQTTEARMDTIARGGERAVERPTPTPSQETSSVESAATPQAGSDRSAGTASTTDAEASRGARPTTSTTESLLTAQPAGTPTTDAGELLDARAWRSIYEAEAERMMAEAQWLFSQEDEHGLPIPPVPCPVFGADAKRMAGKSYDDPTVVGWLRKMAQTDKFADAAADKRIWALYSISRHELAKGATPSSAT